MSLEINKNGIIYYNKYMTIEVVNIKCGGCENSIKIALEKEGYTSIVVDIATQKISFDQDDTTKAIKILTKMGYPLKGSKEEKDFIKKVTSYASCMIGRIKK